MVLKFLVCLRSHVEITYAQIYSPLARFWPTPASSVRTLSISQTTLLTSLMHSWLPSPNSFRTSSIILKQTFELFTYSCAVFTPPSKAYHFLLLFWWHHTPVKKVITLKVFRLRYIVLLIICTNCCEFSYGRSLFTGTLPFTNVVYYVFLQRATTGIVSKMQ